MRRALLAALLFHGPAALAAPPEPKAPAGSEETIPAALRRHYDEALRLMARKDFLGAIEQYNEILAVAPNQRSAQRLLVEARDLMEKEQGKMQKDLRRRYEAALLVIAQGRYKEALLEVQRLLRQDESNPAFKSLNEKLDAVSRIVPSVPSDRKPWRMAAKGLSAVLDRREDLRLAHDALRYAVDLEPADPALNRLLDWLREVRPSLTSEPRRTPGKTLIEYKLDLALDDIQSAKYPQAVERLSEVLALEPANLDALKRLGSAYYLWGDRKQARKWWLEAIKIRPKDEVLKNYLKKVE
jgi:tetratricopeptide (TPR) repeat protein